MATEFDTAAFEQRIERFLRRLNAYLLGEMQKTGFELQADVSSQMAFTQPAGGSFRGGSRLGIESGDLSRALTPGKPGNIFTLAGSIAQGFDVDYGIDEDVIPYAVINEDGGFIRHRGKMPGFLFRLAQETGLDKYRIIAISAKAKGGVHRKAKPYFKPGTEQFESETWPKKLERIEIEIERIWYDSE